MAPKRAPVVAGRDHELTVFEQAVEDARAGSPSVILLAGEAGIGKSTLVAAAAERTGVPLLLGQCLNVGSGVMPLAPVVDLVRKVRRQAPALRDSLELAAVEEVASGRGEGPVGSVLAVKDSGTSTPPGRSTGADAARE